MILNTAFLLLTCHRLEAYSHQLPEAKDQQQSLSCHIIKPQVYLCISIFTRHTAPTPIPLSLSLSLLLRKAMRHPRVSRRRTSSPESDMSGKKASAFAGSWNEEPTYLSPITLSSALSPSGKKVGKGSRGEVNIWRFPIYPFLPSQSPCVPRFSLLL